MNVQAKFLSNKMTDNDVNYFLQLEGIINSVDEEASLMITKQNNFYNFRIAPSHPKYLNILIEQLNIFHNMYKIKVDFSKSIKTSATISFRIQIEE